MMKHREAESVNDIEDVGMELDHVISLSISFKIVFSTLGHMQCF